ncbi:MAG: DUF2306 domain-containing protein [Micromonosporaceae bacterium]
MSTTTELPAPPAPARTDRPRRSWWRQAWVAPVLMLAVLFVAVAVPPYLTGDRSLSRVPTHDQLAWYYPVLVAHIVFGSIALLTGAFQVWPWFRGRYPVAHRWMGRSYFWVGAFPAGVGGLLIAPLSSTGLASQFANTTMAVLWLPISIAGYRMARQRRFPEHRRWMLRSYALTTSIVLNRLWGTVMLILFAPHLFTAPEVRGSIIDAGDHRAMTAFGIGNWLSWIVNLLIVEWWLERTDFAKRSRARLARRAAATPHP